MRILDDDGIVHWCVAADFEDSDLFELGPLFASAFATLTTSTTSPTANCCQKKGARAAWAACRWAIASAAADSRSAPGSSVTIPARRLGSPSTNSNVAATPSSCGSRNRWPARSATRPSSAEPARVVTAGCEGDGSSLPGGDVLGVGGGCSAGVAFDGLGAVAERVGDDRDRGELGELVQGP